MNITRNNYEYFFLLYIDNELSVAEKNEVNAFLQQNADLQPEFDALQNTVLHPDLGILENKNQLFKNTTKDSLQQDLLLLLDDELSQEEKNSIQLVINNDAFVASEWRILQQTKVLPDNDIVFKYKSLLYKKQNAPVIPIFWKRLAIAAILLGFGCWIGVKYYYNFKQAEGVELAAGNYLQNPQHIPLHIASSNSITASLINQKNNGTVLPANKFVAEANQHNQNQQQKLSNANFENINKQKSNIITTTNVLHTQPDLILAANETPSVNKQQNLVNEELAVEQNESYAVNAVYDLEEEISDNKILYIDEEKIKRTKVGGLFRKVKRVFERTADIKTGNTLKIAGFEIAVR